MSTKVESCLGSVNWERQLRQRRDEYHQGRETRHRLPQISASAPNSPPSRRVSLVVQPRAVSTASKVLTKSCPTSPTDQPANSLLSSDTHSRSNVATYSTSTISRSTCGSSSNASKAVEHLSHKTLQPPCSAAGRPQLDLPEPMGNLLSRAPKRSRAQHDVDGPGTGHLSCKKRRLRLTLITSRLSQPFSLPATHILNRESGDDSPVITRFLKMAALGAKKAGHQTTLVRKAAILNRLRLNVRQAAVNRGHERMWKMASTEAMSHGVQLVTTSTGAMYPGRGAMRASVPPGWRPHTTSTGTAHPTPYPSSPRPASVSPIRSPPTMPASSLQPPPAPRLQPVRSPNISPAASPTPTPTTSIMTPYSDSEGDTGEEEESAFPTAELDGRYADLSDDDMDDVYADFEVLFRNKAESPERSGTGQQQEQQLQQQQQEGDHFYEEYLDELDGLPWVS